MDEIEIELKDEGTKDEKADVKVKQSVPDVPDTGPLVGFLGVADPQASKEQLTYVWGYLGQKETLGEKLTTLRDIESRLGTPSLGESRLSRVYNYLKAQNAVDEAEKVRDAFLR